MVFFADFFPGGWVGFYFFRRDDLLDDDREVIGEELSLSPTVPFSFSYGLLRCVSCVSSLWQGLGFSQQCLVEVEV